MSLIEAIMAALFLLVCLGIVSAVYAYMQAFWTAFLLSAVISVVGTVGLLVIPFLSSVSDAGAPPCTEHEALYDVVYVQAAGEVSLCMGAKVGESPVVLEVYK